MNRQQLFEQVLTLPMADRAVLAEQLLASLDQPDRRLDELLINEVERRIDAFDKGEMHSTPSDQVFSSLDSN